MSFLPGSTIEETSLHRMLDSEGKNNIEYLMLTLLISDNQLFDSTKIFYYFPTNRSVPGRNLKLY